MTWPKPLEETIAIAKEALRDQYVWLTWWLSDATAKRPGPWEFEVRERRRALQATFRELEMPEPEVAQGSEDE